MKGFSLEELIKAASAQMRADLRQRLVPHPGELGGNREEIIRTWLRHYLPHRFEISTGFAFDCAGRVSQQLDIIIADPLIAPRFETAGGIRFYPCESVISVGQVRSSMTSRKELEDVLANLESAKSLDRSGGGRAVDHVRFEPLEPTKFHLDQIFTFALVIGDALSDIGIHDGMYEYISARPPYLWPNIVLALDRYLITYKCPDGVCPNPMHAEALALQRAEEDEQDLLMRFYLLLGQAAEVTRTSHLPYWEYLSAARNWNADYSPFAGTADEEPGPGE